MEKQTKQPLWKALAQNGFFTALSVMGMGVAALVYVLIN